VTTRPCDPKTDAYVTPIHSRPHRASQNEQRKDVNSFDYFWHDWLLLTWWRQA